jgi:hypothetical protein
MAESEDQGIVADGRQRALEGSRAKIEKIEARVRVKYAERYTKAGPLERLRIEEAIRREVRTEIEKTIAPADGLY